MGMVLYEMAMSPNAKRARLRLAETGAPFERREVNLLAGEQKTASYKAIQPVLATNVIRALAALRRTA